jgi:hypothetical protein
VTPKSQAADLDLDALERPDAPEPFTGRLGGRTYTLRGEAFFANRVSVFKLNQLFGAYNAHYWPSPAVDEEQE